MTKIMVSGSITSWQIDRKTVETVADFIFWGSKITADGDCSHEIKRHLLLGMEKAMAPPIQYSCLENPMDLISWLQSPPAVILEPQKIKSDTVSTLSPSLSHEVMGPDAMIFVF